jgi:hypothetical protein
MATCNEILSSILDDKCNPIIGGIDDQIIIIKKSLIDNGTVTYNASNKMLIEALVKDVVSPNEVAVIFEGKNYSQGAKSELVKTDFSNTHKHTIMFKAFTNSAAVKKSLQDLVGQKVIAIVRNNFKLTDSTYEVYGMTSGLELSILTSDKNDAATQGAWVAELTNGKFNESYLPATLFKTDAATTQAIVDDLLV